MASILMRLVLVAVVFRSFNRRPKRDRAGEPQ